MIRAYVLMTAMPPTTGHLQLIQFARLLAAGGVTVIVSTQPEEPMVQERVSAIRSAVMHHSLSNVDVHHMHRTLEQDPMAAGFWDMWQELMNSFGITSEDIIVSSEAYGQRLAELTGAQFFPYDIDRCLNPAKATPIRRNPIVHFADMLPEFQSYLRTTVTIFGAESTGKTTLSRQLAAKLKCRWIFEYARPYLEYTVNEITPRSMTAIWRGQAALQRQVPVVAAEPFVIQDTDLFSTVGYWQFPHWQKQLGEYPSALLSEAQLMKSDLYIITKSNIPFEPDPLRYGGDVREGSDEYWIELCRRYELPYIILESNEQTIRLQQAYDAILSLASKKTDRLMYDRNGH
jgi:HTH-type transcriptional repressor of NAD biosynthesis genes